MSDLLAVGATGVRAYQTALTTTSDNIANAGSAGYTRRTTALAEINAANSRLTQGATGNGVRVSGIIRVADALRSAAVRASGADLARSDTSITFLTGIENALSVNQLGSRLTDFFNGAKAVAADPTASAPRAALLEKATSVANAFAATSRAIAQQFENVDSTAQAATSSLETLGAALGKVNAGLAGASPNSAAQAQLLDQRDQILDQLSAISDLSVTTDALGRATVKLGGSGGPLFVTENSAGNVTYARAAGGNVSYAVYLQGSAASLAPNGGALAGIVEGARRLGDTQAQIDAIATDFVDGINAVQAQGRDLDGNPGAPLFAVGAAPTDITLALTNPRGLAAAAIGGGPRDNGNFQTLEDLRATGNFEGGVADLATANAVALQARKTVAEAQNAIHQGDITARDQLTGVNLDSEAVDLLRFQQAYQASSRIIQVARETFQSIIDIR